MFLRRSIISPTIPSFSPASLRKRREIATNRLKRALRHKNKRRTITRAALVAANFIVLGAVVWFVVVESRAGGAVPVSANIELSTQTMSPVDKLTASDVAVSVAKAANLPEIRPVTSQAQSDQAALMMSASDTAIASKPQITDTPLKSWRDIREYVTVEGDTATSVAAKFGVSSNSVKWSNSLQTDTVAAGTKLKVPPAEGIAYVVKDGDTTQSLATKFHTSADTIAADNDAEVGSLPVGRTIFIAGGQVVVAAVSSTATSRTTYTTTNFTPTYAGNGYDWGWCTWYAAARSGAPSNWGNANTWAYFARISGWNVSSTPTDGAIFQTPSGWAGHVGIVEHVNGDGTMLISDMNGIAGFGRVGYATVSVTQYPNYISH